MHTTFIALATSCTVLSLSACGLETAGTAAVSGVVKGQELKQGQATRERAQERLTQSLDKQQAREEQVEKAAR
ncbi:hypothetical protein [Hydrogenophaga sp. OTU3427]|uniref:hypothetical protein n=1 Tax=Hydrogenophaga sp. OTU3427 TaxID=3043856 RepID=UPI00313AD7D2